MTQRILSLTAACVWVAAPLLASDARTQSDTESETQNAAQGRMIPTDQAIEMFRSRIQSDTDHRNRTILGRLYLRKAKEMDDLSAYADAKAILHEAVDIHSGSLEARYYLAETLSACHDFAASIDLLEPIVRTAPTNTAYLAALGDAQLHIGQYKAAARTYQELSRHSSAPAVLSRLAHLDFLHGRVDASLQKLAKAVNTARDFDLPRSERAWFHWRLGDVHLSQGRIADAEASFEAALRVHPNDPAAMLGIAKVHAANGDLPEAITFTRRLVDLHGEPPAMAYLSDLYRRFGDREQMERWIAETDHAMATEAKIAPAPHFREYAMFLADHGLRPNEALSLAEQDAQLRNDIYSDDALAWTSFRAGKIATAVQHIKRALRLNTSDATLHDHAACIYAANRQNDLAKHHRQKILEINANHFSRHQDKTVPVPLSR